MDTQEKAIELLLKTGQRLNQAQKFYQDDKTAFFLMPNGDVNERSIAFRRDHVFHSLEGFVSFLNSRVFAEHGKDGAVMVQHDSVFAKFDYWDSGRTIATLELTPSEECRALEHLICGVDQKTLWRLLVTDLHGCVDPGLLLAISRIKVAAKNEASLDISTAGVDASSGCSAVLINYGTDKGGTATTEINLEWTWCGRIWDEFDHMSEIVLRLELTSKDGLQFRFHPRRIGDAKREAKEALVKVLQERLNAVRWFVSEGVFGIAT